MLKVGESYITRSGHSVLIIEHRPGRKFEFLGKVVYKSGTVLINFAADGECSNPSTPELDIVVPKAYGGGNGPLNAVIMH